MGQAGDNAALLALNDQFLRTKRRAARQKRRIGSDQQAWQRWSTTVDEAAQIVSRLASTPATSIEDLAIKFGAILWSIETNDSLLDSGDGRRLRAFGREFLRLADP
jgi:hypothetical protein